MRQKILLDTDIGSDIDDAVALAYLLAQPDCDLLGITTVTGDTVQRAMLASALCRAAGHEVPIFPGAPEPLLVPQRQPEVPQAVALARWPHETSFPPGEAVEFLRRTIRTHPGAVTLLAIGPLTNLGLLLRTDPEIASLLGGLVIMGGVFDPNLPGLRENEWNILLDPHAAEIVYRTPVALHRSLGLDVTTQLTMERAEVERRFTTPALLPVLDMAGAYFAQEHAEVLTFHDPLAAAVIFDPAICRFERGQVAIELRDPERIGVTHWQRGNAGPHEAAMQVDRDRFFDHFFAVA